MKTRFNKLTAWLLTLAMLMTLVPGMTFTAFAASGDVASVTTADNETSTYTDIGSAINAAMQNSGSTLKLLDNITTDSETYIDINSGNFTIDLGGKTWTFSENKMAISGTADIKITDSSAAGAGMLLATGYGYSTIGLRGSAKLEITGGTVENASALEAVDMSSSGKTTNTELHVSGGKLITNGTAAINAYGSLVKITGGTIESDSDDIHYKNGVIDLTGHKDPTGITIYYYTVVDASAFDTNIKLPDGYVMLDESGNAVNYNEKLWETHTVGVPGTYVASVTTASGGTSYHADITSAVNKAKQNSGSILKLLDNINTDSTVAISGSFTLDLGGKTWTTVAGVLISNNANIKIIDSSAAGTDDGSGILVGNFSYSPILLDGNAKLEIAGGTVDSRNSDYAVDMSFNGNTTSAELIVSGGKLSTNGLRAVGAFGSSVKITGGTFESGQRTIDYKTGVIDLSGHKDPTGITIYNDTGAEVIVSDSTIILPEGYAMLDSTDNAVATLAADTTYTVGEGTTPEIPATYTVTVKQAANGTVEADKTAAAEGDTVTLTVTPASGYAIDTVTYNDGTNDVEIEATEGVYSFAMPASDVTVSAVFEEAVETYRLWVGGVQVTSAFASDVFGDGKVRYDHDTNTLTLKNYNNDGAVCRINDWGGIAAIRSSSAITVKLEGENTLTNADDDSNGIFSFEDITIYGTGSLKINADYGIYTNSNITISGCAVDITTKYDGIYSLNGNITINSGEVVTSSTDQAFNKAPIIGDEFTNAAVWYGDSKEAAIAAGAKDISELATNFNKKYVKIAEKPATYIVTLNANGGSIADGKNVTEYIYGVGAALPNENEIYREGYAFAGWYENEDLTGEAVTAISNTDTGDKTYYAKWTANTDTPYVVNYWIQTLEAATNGNNEQNSTNYTLEATETYYGTSDDTVWALRIDIEGFTKPDGKMITISPDGTTVYDYYYVRNKYNIHINDVDGVASVNGAGGYFFGETVTISATVEPGYKWIGWAGSLTTTEQTHTFTMGASGGMVLTPQLEAKATVIIDETTQFADYDESEKTFKIISDDTLEGFTITYKQNGQDVTPINAGFYDVVLSREEDDTYKAYSKTLVNGLIINKVVVDEPEVGTKLYNGSVQTADVTDTDIYEVTKNEGGADVGAYDVILTLKDTVNYKWKLAENSGATATRKFYITFTENTWEEEPQITGWIFGQEPNEPTFDAKFGDVKIEYKKSEEEDLAYSETVPTNAGNYNVRFTVTGNTNFSGLLKVIDLNIAKAIPSYTIPTGLIATYGDTLAEVDLPNGWVWKDEVTTSVGNAGTNTFKAIFTPDDTLNYEKVEIDVSIAVAKAQVVIPSADNTAFVYNGNEQTYNVAASDYYTVTGNKMTDAGSQDVIVSLKDKVNYTWNNGETTDEKFTFTIAKKAVTATVTAEKKTYDGNTTATISAAVTVADLVPGDSITITGLTGTFSDANAGENKTVTIDSSNVTVEGTNTDCYEITYPATATATIIKADSAVVEAPEAISGLKFKEENGNEVQQSLVTAGVAEGGTMVYRLSPDDEWSESIPVAGEARTHSVYYKVLGDSNHNDTEESAVAVKIAKADAPIVTIPAQKYFYTIPTTENCIDIKSLLPKLCVIINEESEVTGTTGDFIENAAFNNGVLSYDTKTGMLGATGTITVKIVMRNYENVTVTVSVDLIDLNPVSNSGADDTITYNGSTYDVAQMFTKDVNAGEASYEIIGGGSGAGDLNGSVLTITKAGTIELKMTTDANGNYAAGEVTATLTVHKANGAGTVSMDGWTYGETAKTPTIEDETSTAILFLYTGNDYTGSGYSSAVVPTNAGEYTVTATFAENDLYKTATATATFVIAQKDITGAEVGNFAELTYTGEEQIPNATVTVDSLTVTGAWSAVTNVADKTTFTADGNFTGTIANRETGMLKANSSVATAPGANTLTYNEAAQELVTAGAANGGTLKYSLDNETWADTIPTGTDAGNYVVWYKVFGDANHNDTDAVKEEVTINPKNIDKPAEDTTSFTYNGNEQTYTVAENAAYTISNNKRTDAGEQTVKVELNDKANYTWTDGSTDDVTFTFSIARKNIADAALALDGALTYNGEEQMQNVTVTLDGFTAVTYDVTDNKATDVKTDGNYTLKVTASGNFEGEKTLEWNIAKATPVKNTEKVTTARVRRGQTLANATVTNGEFFAVDGTTVLEGTFAWIDDTKEITADSTERMKFTPTNTNYAEIEIDVEVDSYTTGGGGSYSNTTTTTTKNEDGSTTKTTTNKSTGTVTEVTTNTDGSTTTVETKKDGTVTTTEKDKDGNTTTTVEKPDGTSTTTEKNKDGSEKVTEEKADGTTVTTEKDTDGTKTVTTENPDGSITTEETKKDGSKVTTETNADGETKTEIELPKDKETEVTIPVTDAEGVTSITVTDKDGKETEITDFEITEDGVKVTVSGDCTAVINKAAKKEFVDVHPAGHWATADVDYAYINGLMMGTSETHFSPDVPLTRAMLVTVLYRLEGEPATNRSIPFADIDMSAYYANAVIWAQQNGIVKGVSETEFAPNSNITREQIAAIMHRYATFKGYDVSVGENTNILSYDDFAQISEYAIASMQYAVGSGLMKGKSERTLNPLDNATRAETAAILHRFIEANK